MIWSDAVTQARAIRQGATSALELTEEYLRRIERLDPLLRSYVTVDVDRATASARRADQFLRSHGADALPPFHGVPLSVKDVVDVEGMATTHSSKALADNVAGSDAPIVSRWRKAGFVILGKTNVPEFCTSMTSSELNGVCRNPWDTGRTPGGSSGGAAAALAAGLCAVSHGTDGAGSIRVPASFCGLVGMKPTRGLVTFGPEEGTQYFGTSVHGALTRSVRDAAGVLDILVGTDDPASRWSPCPARPYAAGLDAPLGPLRIAVTSTPPYGVTDEQCAAFTRAIGQTLEDLGHHVEWDTPAWNDILAAALGPMEVPGAAALVEADSYALLEPRNRPMVASLAALTVVAHARWVDQVHRASRKFLTFWERYDVLVSPTVGMLPPSVEWAPWDQEPDEHSATFARMPNFAQPFNLSGQPAISLPLAWSDEGLPVGMQIAGRRQEESMLLGLAGQLEAALPWSDRYPPTFAS